MHIDEELRERRTDGRTDKGGKILRLASLLMGSQQNLVSRVWLPWNTIPQSFNFGRSNVPFPVKKLSNFSESNLNDILRYYILWLISIKIATQKIKLWQVTQYRAMSTNGYISSLGLFTALILQCRLCINIRLECECAAFLVGVGIGNANLQHPHYQPSSLRWRHNERDIFSNHQPHDCLLNRLFRQIKENIKAPRHWPLCGESVNSPHKWPVTRKMFPFDDVIMYYYRLSIYRRHL